LSQFIAQPPSRSYAPKFYETPNPLTLEDIEQRLSSRAYSNAEAFDKDLWQVFQAAKAWLTPQRNLDGYGDLLALQRLYQELTKGDGSDDAQSRPFAKATAATGKDQSSKTKDYFDSLQFKGELLKVGDWVHLPNHANPSKPIVGQIFTFSKRKACVLVCLTMLKSNGPI
jgi:chromatin structure-remodeling complex subunit RSC1/2